jgi:hypothetical protein
MKVEATTLTEPSSDRSPTMCAFTAAELVGPSSHADHPIPFTIAPTPEPSRAARLLGALRRWMRMLLRHTDSVGIRGDERRQRLRTDETPIAPELQPTGPRPVGNDEEATRQRHDPPTRVPARPELRP